MVKMYTSETIDLVDIENLRSWIEYMPKCFMENLENKKYNDRLVKDRSILYNINCLYSLIEKLTGRKPEYQNRNFDIGEIDLEQSYKKIINSIPSFDIEKYAKLKLTEEEQAFCHSFVGRCTKENSKEIESEIDRISNFFIRSYAKYLLIYSPKSDFRFSICNIQKRSNESGKKLKKEMKRISRKNGEAWKHSKVRA